MSSGNGRSSLSRNDRKIPDYVLANAHSDDLTLKDIMDIFNIVTERNYTMELVDILLYHLRPDKRTSLSKPDASITTSDFARHLHFQEALSRTALYCATQALTSLLLHCPQHLQDQTTQKLSPHMDELLSWFWHFQLTSFPLQEADALIYLGDPTKPCETLLYILQADNWLALKQHILLSVDKLVEFALSSWLAEDPRLDKMPFHMKSWRYVVMCPPRSCPIAELLLLLFSEENTRQRSIDFLSCSPGLQNRFMEAAKSRCRYASQQTREALEGQLERAGFRRKISAVDMMLGYTRQTLEVTQQLCERPAVSKHFFDHGLFQIYTQAINCWLVQSDRWQEPELCLTAFQSAQYAQGLIVRYRHCSANNWKSSSYALQGMIRGGYLSIVVEALQSPSPAGRRLGFHLVQCLQFQSDVGPRSSTTIHEKLLELRGGSMDTDATFIANPEYRIYWLVLLGDSLAAAAYERSTVSTACDNLGCSGDRKHFQESLTCSRCRAVVYCSPRCQQEDWEILHKQECCYARQHLLTDIRQDRPHYRPSTRFFHAWLSTSRSRVAVSAACIRYPQVKTKLAERPLVVELGITIDPNVKVHTVEEYIRLRGIGDTSESRAPTRYFDNRARVMLNGFSVEEVRAGVRIIEDICNFGESKVYVLAKILVNTQNEPFELIRCISRLHN